MHISYLCVNNSGGEKKSQKFICRRGLREYSRFFYIASGSITFFDINSKEKLLTAHKGDIIYLPHDVEYISRWSDKNDISFIAILFCMQSQKNENIIFSDKIQIVETDRHGIYLKSFKNISEIYYSGKTGYKYLCRSLFWQILYDIMSKWNTEQLSKKDDIYRGIFYIENHFKEDINIDRLAYHCDMCPSAFRKKFREKTGMSPIEYKNFLKTKKAIELLSSGEFNVNEVAEAVGFSDVFYFCKQFKRFHGTSPKKYIKQ